MRSFVGRLIERAVSAVCSAGYLRFRLLVFPGVELCELHPDRKPLTEPSAPHPICENSAFSLLKYE